MSISQISERSVRIFSKFTSFQILRFLNMICFTMIRHLSCICKVFTQYIRGPKSQLWSKSGNFQKCKREYCKPLLSSNEPFKTNDKPKKPEITNEHSKETNKHRLFLLHYRAAIKPVFGEGSQKT